MAAQKKTTRPGRRRNKQSKTRSPRDGVAAMVGAVAAAIGLFFLASPEPAALASDVGVGVRGRGGRSGGDGDRAAEAFVDTVVLVDAGSSGCRLNVYRFDGEGKSLKLSGTPGGKIEPGLSSFATSPKDAAEYILPLLEKASELVPPESHSTTKVLIKSTAGMRLLPPEIQEEIYDEIYAALVGNPLFPFALDRSEVGTIDGDMEAFYAALSANFLAGRIDARMHPTGHASGEIGALDMGGASTQIIFRHRAAARPESNEAVGENSGDDLRRCFKDDDEAAAPTAANNTSNSNRITRGSSTCSSSDNNEDSLFGREDKHATVRQGQEGDAGGEVEAGRGHMVTVPVSQADFWGASHLGYGVAEIRLRVWDFLVERHLSETAAAGAAAAVGDDRHMVVVNPCSFVGRVDEWKSRRLVGIGDHFLCEEIVAAVLWGRDSGDSGEEDHSGAICGKGKGKGAEEHPCGVGGVSMPAVSGDFLAMSVFFYAMHCLHALGPAGLEAWPTPTLAELRDAAEGFCGMDWTTLQDRKDTVSAQDEFFSTSEEGLPHRCVEVVYITTLLRDGYGFPENSRNVTYALETEGMELEWTLGCALAELAGARDRGASPQLPTDAAQQEWSSDATETDSSVVGLEDGAAGGGGGGSSGRASNGGDVSGGSDGDGDGENAANRTEPGDRTANGFLAAAATAAAASAAGLNWSTFWNSEEKDAAASCGR